MTSGLRKVVHVEVFDFEDNQFAYAINSKKNQFGYNYIAEYYDQDKKVKEKRINNVERGAYYFKRFGVNLSQLKSLKRKVKEASQNKMIPVDSENGIELIFRGGSNITYHGKYPDDFTQKVLKYRRNN